MVRDRTGPWNGVVAKISSGRKSYLRAMVRNIFQTFQIFAIPLSDERNFPNRKISVLDESNFSTSYRVPLLHDDIRCNVRDRDRGEKLADTGGDGSRKNSCKVGTNESWKGKGLRSVEFFEGNATLIDREVSMKMVMS